MYLLRCTCVLHNIILYSDPEVTTVHFYSDNLFLVSTELFNRGFKAETWNCSQVSHGEGAPDGIGGALTRKADSVVCKGTDTPGAAELYSALQESETSVKLFFLWMNETWT